MNTNDTTADKPTVKLPWITPTLERMEPLADEDSDCDGETGDSDDG